MKTPARDIIDVKDDSKIWVRTRNHRVMPALPMNKLSCTCKANWLAGIMASGEFCIQPDKLKRSISGSPDHGELAKPEIMADPSAANKHGYADKPLL